MTLTATTPEQHALMRTKLEDYIGRNANATAASITRIFEEVPEDFLAPAPALSMTFSPPTPVGDRVALQMDGRSLRLHDNALNQMSERLGFPPAFVRQLAHDQERNGPDILAYAFNKTVPWHRNERYLLRTMDNQVRGFLSDRFKRIDCRPSLDALLGLAQEAGAMVSQAHVSETRVQVKFILPKIVEIAPGELVVMGIAFGNSDYGRGACSLDEFMVRLMCMNGMVGESITRQVHLGGRLRDDVTYRDRTIQLDTDATAALVHDNARHAFIERPKIIEERLARAAGTQIDLDAGLKALRRDLTKDEFEAAGNELRSLNIERLPPGNTVWRLSNAISWIAKSASNDERRMELEQLAGRALSMN